MNPDVPISSLREDKFGLTSLAETLQESVCRVGSTPLITGVHGAWGSGKTSFLKMIAAAIEDRKGGEQKIESVWFNAWEHQGTDNLIEPLMVAILRQAPAFQRWKAEVVKLGKVVARAAAEVAFRGWQRTLSKGPPVKGEDIIRYGEEYEIPEDEISRLRGEFQNLVLRGVGKNGRLVVFIDDLDRCMPDTALALMEAMKLFFWVENCVFVVAVTREVIESSVKAYFVNKGFPEQDFPFVPSEYLEKIFEFSVNLQTPSPEKLEDYVKEMLKGIIDVDGSVRKLLSDLAEGNPRRAKRFANAISLMKNWWDKENEETGNRDLFNPVFAAGCLADQNNPPFLAILLKEARFAELASFLKSNEPALERYRRFASVLMLPESNNQPTQEPSAT